MLSAIGIITMAVAALLIHMPISPVTRTSPPIRRGALLLACRRRPSPSRSWTRHFWIAIERMNPPRKRKMSSAAKVLAACCIVMMPVSGKTVSGSSEVTGRATASVIHQVAIHNASPQTRQPVSLMPSGAGSA